MSYSAYRARLCAAAVTLAVLSSPRSWAQEGLNAPVTLPEVTVSATTRPTPIADVGSTVTVITAAEIEAEQRRTLPDALAQVPGLNVVQTGGPGGQTSVFIRGTNSNHVKVLIDGIDASDPSNPNGSFDFGQMLTADLAQIEVLRGPQSGLYGSDAIGGVISIFTKTGEGPPRTTLRIEGGTFGTFNQTLGFSGGTPIYDYAFSLAHFMTRDVPVTPQELEPPGQRAIGNFYDNMSLSAKVGLHVSDSVWTEATMRYIDSDLHFTGQDYTVFPTVPNAQSSLQNDHQLYTRGPLHFAPVGTTIRNRVSLAYTQAYSTDKEPDTIYGPTPLTATLGERIKADYQGQIDLLKGETLIVGAETEQDRLVSLPTYARNANSAGYVQLASNFGNRAFLTSNVRYDANENFGGALTYRFAPSFHVPVTETIIKGSYGTGFKAPTLSELYVAFPAYDFTGNPNLKPETSRGYDIGFEQPVKRFSFGALYYQNDIDNLIDDNATFTSYTNIGRAKTYGTEAFVAWDVTSRLKARADYTFTIARDEILDQELLRRPRNKATLQVFWTPVDRLTLSATVLAIGRFIDGNRDFSIPRLVNGGHTTVNLASNYAIGERTSVFARVDNLLDLRYQDPTGFLQPSRAVYGGAQLTF